MEQFGTHFGTTREGREVRELTLDNGILACKILTFGATLRSLRVPGREGPVDVVLGYDSLEQYESEGGYLGAVVGRFANRIAKGTFHLNGETFRLAVNDGPNHLHGGTVGFSHRVWDVAECSASRVVLTLDSPDGEEGYPGRLQVKVTCELAGTALSVRYQARCDRDTPCNLTSHSYFNLAGHSSGSAMDQEITLFASRYTPTDETSIPTGSLEPVEGTPMDLRQAAPIGARINEPFQQLLWGHGYDHNFVVDGDCGTLRPAARAFCRETGIGMDVETTCPGVQFYTANFIEEGRKGKDGAVYGFRHAYCLETQHFPDSPNQSGFPSCILRAGEEYDQLTKFVFSLEP